MLADVSRSDPSWRIACLRYFNPVGAHESGLIGENPRGVPNNLMPFVAQGASERRPHLNVFGNNCPTLEGTGVRDYIHVMDLAEGQLAQSGASCQTLHNRINRCRVIQRMPLRHGRVVDG